jgi:hypothetical protein
MGIGQFGAVAGAVAGLAAGIGISILHSGLSEPVIGSARAPVLSVTALPLPDSPAKPLGSATMAERISQQMKVHRDAIVRHESEPRDSLWASQTERVYQTLLTKLASGGTFRVTSVDCRTSSCVAYFSAASYQDAQLAWPSILNAQSDTKCTTEVTLGEPQSGESSFDFSAVYDCSHVRQLQAAAK